MEFAVCLKYAMIIFNVLFALIGLGFVGVGTFVYVAIDVGRRGLGIYLIFAIIKGSFIIIVSSLGFCGACAESCRLLVTYGISMFLLAVVYVVLAVVIFLKVGDLVSIQYLLKGEFTTSQTLQFLPFPFCHNLLCLQFFEYMLKRAGVLAVCLACVYLMGMAVGFYLANCVRKGKIIELSATRQATADYTVGPSQIMLNHEKC